MNEPNHTTVIREGGSNGGIILGAIALVLVAIGGFYVINTQSSSAHRDDAIASAANKVGSAAEKAGDAAQDSTTKN